MKKQPILFLILLIIPILITACGNSTQTESEEKIQDDGAPDGSIAETNEINGSGAAVDPEKADIVFTNGTILSMAPVNEVFQAIAIKENRIISVGGTTDMAAYIADATQIIDLNGRTLMPGFIDAHQHLFDDAIIYGYDPLPNQQIAIENGITAIADMFVDEGVLSQLANLSNSGDLRVRLIVYLVYTSNCGDATGDWWRVYQPGQVIGPNLQIGGIKIFTDGGSCGIPAMSVEYPGGGFGNLFFTQNDLIQAIREVDAAGFQAAIHALGDRSLEQVLNAIEDVSGGEKNRLRHRIEHNSTIRPELLARYNETGALPVIFGAYPTCIRAEGGGVYKYVLSSDYGEWDWPWRALLDTNPGIQPAWHSDFLALPNMSPLYHAWGMVTRKSVAEDGSICEPPDWLKAGALRIEEVLPMMTINAAYAVNREKEIGSLEAGKLADLVILSENPLTVPADEIKDIQVLMTMIDGEVEYCAESSICPVGDSNNGDEPLTGSITFTSSSSLPENPPALAMDGNPETIWSAGMHPEQWIQVDLGAERQVTRLNLLVSQYPAGDTIHQIWTGQSGDDLKMVYEFNGYSTDGDIIEFIPAPGLENIRIIRILSKESPSWIAWREIVIESD